MGDNGAALQECVGKRYAVQQPAVGQTREKFNQDASTATGGAPPEPSAEEWAAAAADPAGAGADLLNKYPHLKAKAMATPSGPSVNPYQ